MGLRADFLSKQNTANLVHELGTSVNVRSLMETYPVSDLATFGQDRWYQLRQVNNQFVQYYRSVYNCNPFDVNTCNAQIYSNNDAAVAQMDFYTPLATNAGMYDMTKFDYRFGQKICEQERRPQFGPFRNVNNYKGINNPHIIGAHKRHIERDPEYFEESLRNNTRESFQVDTRNNKSRNWAESTAGSLWQILNYDR